MKTSIFAKLLIMLFSWIISNNESTGSCVSFNVDTQAKQFIISHLKDNTDLKVVYYENCGDSNQIIKV